MKIESYNNIYLGLKTLSCVQNSNYPLYMFFYTINYKQIEQFAFVILNNNNLSILKIGIGSSTLVHGCLIL